jgi:hypothetical protein
MTKYIIIIHTDIIKYKHQKCISMLSDSFPCISKISVDLDDFDKVMRIESLSNISYLIIAYLGVEDIKCKLMGIYKKLDEQVIVLFE